MTSSSITIAEDRPDQRSAVAAIYPLAFPDEDLAPLVAELWQYPDHILSLVAVVDNAPVAHALFSYCSLEGTPSEIALLGPVAVHPEQQRSGLGSQLIYDGLARLKQRGTAAVCVLGDPNYYSRFGFGTARDINPPYSPDVMPPEWEGAWQSLILNDQEHPLSGRLQVPKPWDHSELWLP